MKPLMTINIASEHAEVTILCDHVEERRGNQ
jgi:hypothetical protein